MSNTDKISVMTQYLVDLLTTNKVALGLQDVYYGDQDLIPKTPIACIDPAERTRELKHTGFQTENRFTVYVILYHGKIQDVKVTKKESIEFAEGIEALLHANKQMGGLVVYGFCEAMDSGFSVRGKDLWRATRITWTGVSKTII